MAEGPAAVGKVWAEGCSGTKTRRWISNLTWDYSTENGGRDGGSRTRNAPGYEPVPGTARIAAMTPR